MSIGRIGGLSASLTRHMSVHLWRYFLEDDVEKFCQFLAYANPLPSGPSSKGGYGGAGSQPEILGSAGTSLSESPTLINRPKRGAVATLLTAKAAKALTTPSLSRADINARDSAGCTLLHLVASSNSKNAFQFAVALLELPTLDLYIQDFESGWTALHRALYFGNVAIAQALMDRDIRDAVGHSRLRSTHHAGALIKIKDREGNSPFDVYGASITARLFRNRATIPLLSDSSAEDEEDRSSYSASVDADDTYNAVRPVRIQPRISIKGDEIFAFGTNKNFTLGFGDEDDRQHPERIILKRPDHLLQRLWIEHQHRTRDGAHAVSPARNRSLPTLIQSKPIIIQDARLSKFHSAILTDDPEANLYMCGFGPGGRLGVGDEKTRFNFVPVFGGGLLGKKVTDIALGQSHTVAVTSDGEAFSWGNNTHGQLGFASPSSNLAGQEPIHTSPRQIFGPLKREIVKGAAASDIHSVVHTSTSLYTFGKNEGQLGLVDSDSRSLATQTTPRKVAASLFSSSVSAVSAIDRATICLLENHEVWIFANFGYTRLPFPVDSSPHIFPVSRLLATHYNTVPNHICKITSGGDMICALSSAGDVFAVSVGQKIQSGSANGSTTNPSKIRNALSNPQKIWTQNKGHMAVRDVGVGQDSSIIICTEAGSVWQRIKRPKVKDANVVKLADQKTKDYKFSRVPGLTRIAAVRSNMSGAYAAVRRDCDVLRSQICVDSHTIWRDLFPLLSFSDISEDEEDSETENPRPRFWVPKLPDNDVSSIVHAVLSTSDLEGKIAMCLSGKTSTEPVNYDIRIGSTKSKTYIPAHECIVSGRSEIIRRALIVFRQNYFFSDSEIMTIEYDQEGKVLMLFQEVDIITILNLVLYMYTDTVIDVWRHVRNPIHLISRYRLVRAELMKISSNLELRNLEQAVRTMTDPPRTLHLDMESAVRRAGYFEGGDVEIELDGASLKAHSAILCQRCPFFRGLFNGRAAGRWLSARRERMPETIKVDLKHVNVEVFKLLRRHLYADAGEEIFDNIQAPDLESFLDLVLEVLSVANELMLDRLAQCCQKVLGNYGG